MASESIQLWSWPLLLPNPYPPGRSIAWGKIPSYGAPAVNLHPLRHLVIVYTFILCTRGIRNMTFATDELHEQTSPLPSHVHVVPQLRVVSLAKIL